MRDFRYHVVFSVAEADSLPAGSIDAGLMPRAVRDSGSPLPPGQGQRGKFPRRTTSGPSPKAAGPPPTRRSGAVAVVLFPDATRGASAEVVDVKRLETRAEAPAREKILEEPLRLLDLQDLALLVALVAGDAGR